MRPAPTRKSLALVTAVMLSILLVVPAGAVELGDPPVADLPSASSVLDDDPLPPHPDPAFLHPAIPSRECTVENDYEAAYRDAEIGEVLWEGHCNRIRFAFGPIVVKPGENDALIEPILIDKPAYDGYLMRFKPNLVLAATGEAPPTEEMHLHHATWLALSSPDDNYGSGPLFAAGEEKTIFQLPSGYGQPVSGDDVWALLYMVHNEQADSQVVWLTYDIDFIPKAIAEEELGILPAKQIWLDVQGSQIHPDAPSTSSNPVFNVQRGFGDVDDHTGRQVCRWPDENCARFDTYNMVTPQQGRTHDDDGVAYSDLIGGNDWTVPARLEGTLVVAGGHLHPGGIRDEVSLVRNGEERPIFYSDALYWDWEEPGKVGGPPWSWNFSMTGTAPEWRVDIKAGDRIRINAVVDSEDASWYEGMGIVMAWVATDGTHGEPSVDVFDDDVILDPGVATSVFAPEGPYDANTGWRPDPCEMDLLGQDGQRRLCLRGGATHGHLDESGNFSGGCRNEGDCPDLVFEDGEITTDIISAAFTYGDADLGLIETTGIPLLRKGEPARFWNYDTVARIWHTYTRCAYPCNGSTDMAFPIADGGNGSPDDHMDFDSAEIGFGTFVEPASGQIPPPGDKGWEQTVQDSLYWEFTPTETGVYTFYCRIHHGMRGAFKVVD